MPSDSMHKPRNFFDVKPEVRPMSRDETSAYVVRRMWHNRLRSSFLYRIALLCLSVTSTVSAPFTQQNKNQDDEIQMGQEVFNALKAKGEIVESSPLYDSLRPIADAITRVAQPQYNHPFKFYLVHEAQPNAFATPGGNIYVVDSLLFFVKNTEQLAGTLCHEVSHTIHHDTMM